MLNPGETIEVKGSAAKPYIIKNHDGVIWSCSCPGWRNCGGAVEKKSCKHLRKVRGDAAEAERIGQPILHPVAAYYDTTSTVGTSSKDPNVSGGPRFNNGDGLTVPATGGRVDEDEANRIKERALSQGRKLRQDEKAKLHGPPVLLANSFEDFDDLDPTGWWYSEKLDGVRAWWNGENFISRQGNIFHAPAWFKEHLPKHLLDGELWMGRKMFQKTISVVKRLDGGDLWKDVSYVVFDVPHVADKPFEDRMEILKAVCSASESEYLQHLQHHKVQSRKHLLDELKAVESLGGEGLMIRKPGAAYENGRSSTILKVKPFKDAEGEVVGHVPGKGRHKGVLGALVIRMPNGKEFNLGTGLTDAERRDPPKVGKTVTYRFTELTDGGLPKCTGFLCVRDYE